MSSQVIRSWLAPAPSLVIISRRRNAERRVVGEFVADLKRVSGKENILFKITEAVVGDPDGVTWVPCSMFTLTRALTAAVPAGRQRP